MNGTPPTDPKVGWRERLAATRYAFQLIQLVWETNRTYTLLMALLRVVRAFVPVALLWVAKLIIDTVIASRAPGSNLGGLWQLVLLEIVIVVLGDLLARSSALIESLLGDLFSNTTSIRLMEHAATLDLYQFENPKFYDQLERARRQTTGRIVLLSRLFAMAQDILTLLSLGTALVLYSPFLLFLLAASVFPSFIGETHFAPSHWGQ